MAKEESRRLKSTIQRMRPNDKKCIMDFHFRDMSLNEMQKSYSIPLGTVKRRLHTARKRLAEALS
jgi:RNA polymerase sigma-70 factor (ECF subfamily)